MSKKSKRWYVHFPSDAYALGPYRFENPVDERHVRNYVRKHMGYSKLPANTKCWIAND